MTRFEGFLLIVFTLIAAAIGSALPQLFGQSGNNMVVSGMHTAAMSRRIDVAGSGVV